MNSSLISLGFSARVSENQPTPMRRLRRSVIALITAVGSLTLGIEAHATVFFSFDAESGVVGNAISNPPFCGFQCGGGSESGQTVGRIGSTGGAAQGSKYFYWNVVQNQHDHYNEIRQSPNLPSGTNLLGRTIYLAYNFRFERSTGGSRYDIFNRGNGVQSAEKGIEIRGPGLRWVTSMGQWDTLASNASGKFSTFIGNPSYHLNSTLEHNDIYFPNQSGFTSTSPVQLDYEKWHSIVLGIKLATDRTGTVAMWVNGTKAFEYLNIQTVAAGTSTATVDYLELGGTLCQPAYDCPPHVRKYDAMLLTDTWQDVVNGGYLSTASGATVTAPAAPTLQPPTATP